ncbi:acyl-coenzyme A--6-aminopenicillanic-acid-acyltransferase form [Arthrobacter sp. MYb211]|uniref:C45 family autoproteolytic acyltransferase/hydolase n=1 Tax=Micrococcaceae TaxID=1268 RepID=UPI000CFCFA9C|nr:MULTISPECIES: C45 family peptidase [unclassified Arthrobacter]PRA02470.1 acyl-coenzyme A--6-aminopenicillanic-acid-acyltransferase form [Arthrobacter sp. MYb229]PRA13254.1 acyl-coenzyme A--6-aminopenicillanic-acid-acyltransferase form [Arthrobacter sp. MYb221]PRB50587.1 acyl-coenzyme A--6-aminopenicillanic-acid-acyltransferase form [Arthrobacter sp. MYb216]PRC10450.1 acyl-coenzyme A--6-aminopenicillanic-acid-acyltransferase form [Arthrobacter sp. MYb211]
MEQLKLRTLEISGTPRERGRQYGQGAADLITKAISFYTEAFDQQLGRSWEGMRERAAAWVPLCAEKAPEIMEEIAGIAEGAGVQMLDILLLNLRGEVIYDAAALPAPDEDEVEGCTSFALLDSASGDGHVYAGQNWDWRHGTRDTVLILRVVQDPLPTLIMQVEAGQIGRHGANSAGIALNANGLGGRFGTALGLPQTFIRRMVLNQSEFADALNTLVRTKTHIASNALLTFADGFAIDVETTPGRSGWMYPTNGLLVHGNHYQAFIPAQLAESYQPVSVDSLFRVPRTEAGLSQVRMATDSQQARQLIHQAMSDHLGYPESVCTHPDVRRPEVRQWSTLLSSCIDLTTGEYFIAPGNPCTNDYQILPWNVLDGPGSRNSIAMGTTKENAS